MTDPSWYRIQPTDNKHELRSRLIAEASDLSWVVDECRSSPGDGWKIISYRVIRPDVPADETIVDTTDASVARSVFVELLGATRVEISGTPIDVDVFERLREQTIDADDVHDDEFFENLRMEHVPEHVPLVILPGGTFARMDRVETASREAGVNTDTGGLVWGRKVVAGDVVTLNWAPLFVLSDLLAESMATDRWETP